MIGHLRGTVTEKSGNTVIIDVNGVGYEVMVPTPDYEAAVLNEERKFYTYHQKDKCKQIRKITITKKYAYQIYDSSI